MKRYNSLILVFCIVLFAFVNGKSSFAGNYKLSAPSKYPLYVKKLMEQKQPEAAEAFLNTALKKYPSAIDLIYLRAKIRGDYLNNFNGSFADYSMAIKYAGKSFPKAYWRRADIFAHNKQFAYALKDYTSCLKLIPKYGKVYFKRAKAYLKLGFREKAKIDLQKCIRFSPVYKEAVLKFQQENQLW
jgi:tetratricopeptide (TPR) repeat protein